MKLEKFPVTAPDGTEYRVTITEEYHNWFGWSYEVTVYKQRRSRGLFRFKNVRTKSYHVNKEGSRASGDWLVMLAREEVLEYIENVNAKLAEERGIQEAAEAFRKWDGKIADKTESMEVSE